MKIEIDVNGRKYEGQYNGSQGVYSGISYSGELNGLDLVINRVADRAYNSGSDYAIIESAEVERRSKKPGITISARVYPVD